MSKLKVNVTVAGKSYPMSVSSVQEEQGLRSAAKKINTLIEEFENRFEIADKEEVLAMCALKYASNIEVNQVYKSENKKIAMDTLNDLTTLVDYHLK